MDATAGTTGMSPWERVGASAALEQLNMDFGPVTEDFESETARDFDMSPEEVLQTVDWDFPERSVQEPLEAIHPYPARFISEIPRSLLDALPLPSGAIVLDPFCGSGTTLVECQRRGIPAIGIDLNPIACLMSRVKTTPIAAGLRAHALAVAERARTGPAVAIPDIPNLDHWFQPDIQDQLARLLDAIDSLPVPEQDSLKLALSSIIVRVSNQESDTRYAAVSKDVGPDAVRSLFLRATERLETALRARRYRLSSVSVIQGDTLSVEPSKIRAPVGLVITSPPYPNAYEYWLYHKYRMWWLGFDALNVKEREIGARAHFFKKNHHTPEDFSRQMRQTFALLECIVMPGGYVCFVVGRSQIHGRIVDNAKIISEAGATCGFSAYFATDRLLAAHRKSFNLSHANIKKETILILRKEPF